MEESGSDGSGAPQLPQSELHVKKQTPRTPTPRNVVFPDPGPVQNDINAAGNSGDGSSDEDGSPAAADENDVGSDTGTRRNRRHLPPSARKYLQPDDAAQPKQVGTSDTIGLATGLPSPRNTQLSARDDQHRPRASSASARRTLRGSIHHLRHESVQLAKALIRSSRRLYRQLSLQQLLAYLLIIFGLFSESFTPGPRHNVPIGTVLFMTASSSSLIPEYDHRIVVSGLCLTSLMDIMWLLRPPEGSFNGFLRVQIENATHLCVAMCLAIKLWLIFATYFDLGPELDDTAAPLAMLETSFRARLWNRLRYFLPRKTLPRRSQLSYEVLMRVLVLVWIHGVCGALLLVLGLMSVMGLSGKAVFRSALLGLPLPLAILFKSASTLLTYILATQNMSYHGCFKVFGCDRLARFHEESATNIVLKYNSRWLRRVKYAKMVDALLGVYLMVVYYSAINATTFIAGESVLAVLVLTIIATLVLDVWTPLLIMVVARCGTVLHQHHRNGTVDVDPYFPNQLEWDDEDDTSSNKKRSNSSSSSASSSDGLDASSSDGDEGEVSSSSESSGSARRRSQRRLQTSSRKASSRSPLIPAPLKRANSMLIVDASELADRPDLRNSAKPYWIRYWDESYGRSYLAHSITNETVWEIGSPVAASQPSTARATGRKVFLDDSLVTASATAIRPSPRTIVPALPSSSSFPPMRSARESARARSLLSARASSHPTSESDVIVTTSAPPKPMSPRPLTSSHHPSPGLLAPEDFMLLWDTLPDGGSFTCRVSKVPTSMELQQHLHTHGFSVASDGLNLASLRTIHFFAVVSGSAAVNFHASESGRHLSLGGGRPVVFFLGEFVVDSLSLKLYAKFRCQDVDAIVPFVKKLQLKEIVGAYAPCD